MKPLEGIRVLELATYFAAPMCGHILADWGAEVIKVEGPAGDPYRTAYRGQRTPKFDDGCPSFDLENANKKFVCLDAKHPQGREALLKLAAQCDVFLTNNRPRALEKMQMTYEDIKAVNPEIVYADMTGYGSSGPLKDKPGYDYTAFFSRSGLMADLSPKGESVLTTVAGFGDHVCAITLAGGICAALLKAKTTGVGEHVNTALYQSAIFIQGNGLLCTYYGREYPRDHFDCNSPLLTCYKCKDGEWVYLPKSVKKTVDEVVDKLEELPVVQACYDQWYTLQNEVDSYYHDKPREKKKLSQEKEFRQIKNAVIQEAERIRLGEITFEDANLAGHDEAEQVRGESDACWKLRQIIRDESLSLADRDEVAEELERLAERGDTHAQYLMGQLYRDGPLLIPDSQKAKHWFTQAAIQGLTEAQYALGKLLLSGDLEVRDPDEGIRWLKQAAENGSHFAAYRLGKEYLEGNAVNKDATRAADWFTQSAEAGNQYAQYMLGKLYLTGQGVTHDHAQAMDWFSRSAAQGNRYAQFFLEHQNYLRPPSVMLAATHLLYHMSRIFEDHALPQSSAGLHVDRKLRRRIQEKKIAMGHKPDDHEEEQNQGGMIMGGM